MTKKYFIVAAFCQIFVAGFVFFLLLFVVERQENTTLTAKNKLLRRALHNFQWEVEQAHSRNQELDAMRWSYRQTKLRYPEWLDIIDKIYFYSKLYGVRPELSMSVAHRESFFIADARSNVAWGLFQINLEIWKDELKLNEQNVLDLDTNIRCGIWILKQYLVDCGGDEIQALNKYWTGSVIPPHDGYIKRIYSSKFMLTK